MTIYALDVLSRLPELEWRGIALPLVARSVRFNHSTVTHRLAFRDGELIDSLGVGNWSFSYVIPFRQGIAKGPYNDLYTVTFPLFVEAFRDRTEGPLIDPVLGEFTVRPDQLSIDTDINRRDGEDISVTFIHSPAPDDDDTLKVLSGITGVISDASALDSAAEAVMLEFDIDDLLSDLKAQKAQWDSIGMEITQTLANLSNAAKDLEEEITDPKNWPMQRASRDLRMAIEDIKETALEPLRDILKLTTKGPQTIGAIASLTNTSMEELINLNPALPSNGPTIPGGITIRYWKNN